ncbi:uncharacterized protein LOC110454419 [Mizuhopecten yessoensis]|uniref:Uncharacterized protein n=1 Tax=Mizuhopecten yessoensis TaxID=6573 RepID=A0A210QF63_MIZYE|nr:uncharacterized protein LOC110454419 [Mizuhopecten yessoensis]OWF47386.1 hypothetical protein KP79_PYT08170 [Mizuhopecten yessoensis]
MLVLNIFLILFLAYVSSDEDTLEAVHEDENKFGHLEFDSLPERVKEVLRESRATDNGDHWCCKITPTKTIVDSHVSTIRVTVPVKHTGTRHCGFLHLGRCHTTSYTAGYKTGYKATYSSRVVHTTCPDKHLTCCNNYILVAGQCLLASRLPDIQGDLINLHNHDIVVG